MRASECDALYAFRERQQGNGSRCLQAVDADLLAAADEQQDLPVVGEQAGARLLCSRKDRAECVVEASAESAREQQDGRRLLGSAREGELRISGQMRCGRHQRRGRWPRASVQETVPAVPATNSWRGFCRRARADGRLLAVGGGNSPALAAD